MIRIALRRYIALCFVSTIVSLVTLGSLVIFFGNAKPRDEVFFQSLMDWTHPAYFATYDFQHYVTGILIFALMPFILVRFLPFYKNRAKLVHIAGITLSICTISVISYFFYTKVYLHADAVIHALTTKTRGPQLVRDSVFIPLSLLLYGICYIFLKYSLHKRISFSLKRRIFPIIPFFDLFLFLSIVLLIFNPAYKYSYEKLANYGGEAIHQFHHVASYIGPIHEIVSGKTPLVDVFSQYGILAVSIPAALFSFVPLTFANFTLYSMIVAILYTWLFYRALLVLTKSHVWAMIGLLLYIKLEYFRWFFQNDIFVYPSATPLRYFFDIVVFFAMERFLKQETMKHTLILAFCVGLSLLYNVEMGLALLVASLGTIAVRKWSLRALLPMLSLFLGTFLVIAAVVTLVIYTRSHQFPQWSLLTKAFLFFGRGFFDFPMPIIGAYYFPLSVYLVSFYVALYKIATKNDSHVPILVFLILYGLGSFVYYLGFNEPHHLMTIAHPSLLLSILLGSWLLKEKRLMQTLPLFQQSIIVWYSILLLLFFVWKPGQFVADILKRLEGRYIADRSTYHHWNYPGADFYLSDNTGRDFALAVASIDTRIPKKEKVFILSRYDTLLFVMADRPSAFSYSYLEYEKVYKTDIESLIEDITKNPPPYVFVASGTYDTAKTDNIALVWEATQHRYRFVEHAGAVDVYERLPLDANGAFFNCVFPRVCFGT